MPNYAGYSGYSNYAAGDYYGYAAGGFNPFKIIGGAVLGGVKGLIKGGVSGAVKGAVGGAISAAKGKQSAPAEAKVKALIERPPSFGGGMMIPQQGPIMVPKGTPGAMPEPGVGGTIARFLPGGQSGYVGGAAAAPGGYHWNKSFSYARGLPPGSFLVRNRSMNPANPRALRRAARRQRQFVGVARVVLRNLGLTIKRSGSGAKAPRRRR